MAFKLTIENVFRDFSQGLYGNRIPLDDEDVLEILKLWDQLVEESLNDPASSIIYDDWEVGGAHPQVTAEFTNRDFMEVYRLIRQIAPHTSLRPLDRSANVFMLAPLNEEDIEHIIKQLAQDIAHPKFGDKVKNILRKLLNIKIFDSQGIIEEMKSTLKIISKLRHGEYKDELGNKVEYLINAETAIPYGKGPFYTKEIYLKKVEDSYNAILEAGLPVNESRISLKDMIGQLDAKAVRELLPEILKKLKTLQEGKGTEIPIGLHLHDTGCAVDAYVEAIKICKQEFDYPIVIDTVECDAYKPEYTGKNSYKNTGFVSLRELNQACLAEGIDLGLKQSQLTKLDKMGALAKIVAEKYSVRRVESLFSGEELRDFDIPGGGFASFSEAVKNAGIATKLDLSERDALLLAGNGLKAVAKLMGYPFAVTPGFQNKQIAALNLINNMIEAKRIKPGMSIGEILEHLSKDLSDQEVEKFFLQNLSKVVEEFLQGEMPADTLRKMGIETTAQVHPKIREKLGRREKLLTETVKSKLAAARKVVEKLDQEGLIKPTKTQIEAVAHEFQGQSEDIIQKILKERAYQTHITWALELGDPNRLEAALKKPWLHEPDPKLYQGKKAEYLRAVAKSRKGKNPVPDEMETRLEQMQAGKLSLDSLYEYKQLKQESERLEIWRSVIIFIQSNLPGIETALSSEHSHAMDDLYEKLYQFQEKMISSKESKGEYYLTSNKRRHDMALDFMAAQLTELKAVSTVDFHTRSEHKRQEIEAFTVKAGTPGNICKLYVKPGDVVKEGDLLLELFAMKNYHTITSSMSGIVEKVSFKENDPVNENDIVITFRKEEKNESQTTSVQTQYKIDPQVLNDKLLQHQKADVDLLVKTKQMQIKIDREVAEHKPEIHDENDLLQSLQKRGFFGPPLTLTEAAKQGHEQEIHVIGNRDTSGIKLLTDLKQVNCDVRLLYVDTDKDTALIKHAKEHEKILVKDYHKEYKSILGALRKLAQENPEKIIYFHPGWGFLSEKSDFVKEMEDQLPKNVIFVGPPSEAMLQVGSKKTCRHMVKKVVPEFNPGYMEEKILIPAVQIKDYINSDFSKTHALHETMLQLYQNVLSIGGDVMIKAVDGGGGYGIQHFTANENKDNYQEFVRMFHKNVDFSEGLYHNGEMLIEEFVGGKTRHLEVQLAVNDMGAMVFGIRDCTSQEEKAKTNEMNVIQGDYPDEVTSETMLAIKKLGQEMSAVGYRGLCTVELLVARDGKITESEIKKRILEANTRLQVEHSVSEEDVRIKTGKNISLPLINLACVREKNITLAEILKRDFGFTDADLMKMFTVGTERVEHVRLNSCVIDVLTGNKGPSFYWGYMWPGQDIIAKIAKETGAHIIIGDIGGGNYNRQTGAVWGTTQQVQAALTQINKLVEVTRACMREDGTLSVDSVFAFHELVFDEKGNFNNDFTTLTQDEFLKAVKQKEVKVEMDKQHLGTTPVPKLGAMKKAFTEFLTLQAEKLKRGLTQFKQAAFVK
jgi:acetyl/propionyl-CoA carboxylase alpha subunit/pyruvate/oxaloacetate carboxyltransferase